MTKILSFRSDEEAAEFWDTHSFEEYAEDTKEAEIEFVKKTRKKAFTIRLELKDIELVQKIAEKKGLSYTALIRMWIREHLARELSDTIVPSPSGRRKGRGLKANVQSVYQRH